jgi:3-oxoacyl-[acyl-carrier protein] reductase
MEIKGKLAIITGSSGQIGDCVALALAAKGADCICHYNKNRQKAEYLAKQIQEIGVKALAIQADLTDEKQIEMLFEKAESLGTPQILINSAAIFSREAISEIRQEFAQELINTNLISPILMSRIFTEKIAAKFGGSTSSPLKEISGKIINIADICGLHPWANYVLYCSSKAGLIGATKALAKELAPAICVNAVAPGIVTWPDDYDEERRNKQISKIPLKRIARPEEIAQAIIGLIENDYITGQVLCVDGGRSI